MSNWIEVNPAVDYSVRKLCFQPYINHPKGCPNYKKRGDCPPKSLLIENIFDLTKPTYFIYNKFDFKSHCDRMKSKHPEWSKRQVECCLYWQGTARKQLNETIRLFLRQYPQYSINKTPEGCGVNITKTMKQGGISLEWPPKNVTYQIVMAGINRKF